MALTYNHRVAFGVWINDMRNEGMPGKDWPYVVMDERTVEDIIGCLQLQAKAGFNEFDIAGLFVSHFWPVDIVSAVDKDRRRQINRILEAAHNLGIKVIDTLGVYSWGFKKIIESCPELGVTSKDAMCGSKPESWVWMKKVIDYIASEFEIDGFHLESSDLGRCTCPLCREKGDVEYHCGLNKQTAEYIRSRWPEKILMVNMCGYTGWRPLCPPEDKKHLLDLGDTLDYLIDPGHLGFFIEEESRREFISALSCDFGTSGGFWIYPPQRWNRLRWFLPYTMKTAQHIAGLYAEGGRAVEYYMGPTINPAVEVNITFGGKFLSDTGKGIKEILVEVIDELYRPKDSSTCNRLADIFQRAESAYFDQWSEDRIFKDHARPGPGELHLEPLTGRDPGPARYLKLPFLDSVGRAVYREKLLLILRDLSKIETCIRDKERIRRIEVCIRATIEDIDSIEE